MITFMNEKERNVNKSQDENNNLKNDEMTNAENNRKNNKQSRKNVKQKSRTRMYIVLLFMLIVLVIGYVIYRGEYLEILEMGEEYISIFWQNVNYSAITFGINFLVLFIVIYMNNNRIKKALK